MSTQPGPERGELFVPISLAEEMAEAAWNDHVKRQDLPINFFGFASNRLPLQSLSGQPSKAALLKEVKGWAWIAGSAVARRVRGIKMTVSVQRRTTDGTLEEEVLDDHILKAILDKPNNVFSGGQMRWLLAWHLQQTGEGYWQKLRDGLGVVREYWPLPPQNVDPVPSETDVIGGYQVRTGKGQRLFLPREDVIRFWNPDPFSLYTSIGTLGPMALEWDADRFMEEHWHSHFKNDASPRIVITGREGAVAPIDEQKKDFFAKWKQQFHRRDGEYVGVPAFIPPGFDAKELSAHGGAQELVPLGEQRKTQFMMAYGVPPSIVGDVVDANRAAAETNQYTMDRNTVEPLYDVMVEAITDQSAKPDFDEKLIVRSEPFVAKDKEFELGQEDQDLRTAVRSPQQILRDRGKDIEDASWGEFPLQPISMGPYTGEVEEDDGDFELEDQNDLRAAYPGMREDRAAPDDIRMLWARVIATEKKFTGPMQRAMLSIFDDQRRVVLKELKKELRSLLMTDAYDGVMRVAGGDVFKPRDFEKLFRRKFEPIRGDVFRTSGKAALGSINKELTFSLSKSSANALKRQGVQLASDVNKATLKKVVRALSEGAGQGEGISELTTRMNAIFRDRKRARTIARTELLKASQSGQIEGFKQSGVVERKQWNDAQDGDVRDSHLEDGIEEVALDDDFTLGSGAQAAHPGDPRLAPEEVINCRCFVSPVIEES